MPLTQTKVRVQELKGEVASLMRTRDLSQQAYEAGAIPLTNVLDADRQLLTVRDDLDGTSADAARAAVRSFRALGGGWDTKQVRQSSTPKHQTSPCGTVAARVGPERSPPRSLRSNAAPERAARDRRQGRRDAEQFEHA
jgi:hypothetical protein